jgi:uncharacterized membrane protein
LGGRDVFRLYGAASGCGANLGTAAALAALGGDFHAVFPLGLVVACDPVRQRFLFGGFAAVGLYVHIMLAIGILMMLIFGHVYFAGFSRLKRGVAAKDWKAAGAALGQIRMLIGINLSLGLINIFVAILGKTLF